MFTNQLIFQNYSRSLMKHFFSINCSRYHKQVIDHYENPRNVGSLNKDEKNVGTGLVGAPACGDVMKLQIKVNDDGVIENAVFKVKNIFINLDFRVWFGNCLFFICY